jgi:SAM-dependent methyltransferase
MSRTPAERSRDWYQANAHRYDRRHPGLPGDTKFYASLCHGQRVLEIGAGTGRITAAIAEVAHMVVAIDNAPAMLTTAKRRLGHNPRVALLLADAGDLPFAATFDRIILSYRTVQHLDTSVRRRFWHVARSLLAPAGIVAFDTWHGPISLERSGSEPAIVPVSESGLNAELHAANLHLLGVQTSFEDRQDSQSLTRVWLSAPRT